MDCKKFFMPSIGKIALFVLLMGGLNYWTISTKSNMDARIYAGLPLGFWPVGSFMYWPGGPMATVEFFWIAFVIDLLFWYLISCGIIFAYNSTKKSK